VTKKEGKKNFFNKIAKEKKITKITKIRQEKGKTERKIRKIKSKGLYKKTKNVS
jgi:hypothetical protein